MGIRISKAASALGLALALIYSANGALVLVQLPSIAEVKALADEPERKVELSGSNEQDKAAVYLARCVENGARLTRNLAEVVEVQYEVTSRAAYGQVFAGLTFGAMFLISMLGTISFSRNRSAL